jgi:hypothetical protein
MELWLLMFTLAEDLKASPGAYDKLTAVVIEVEVAINY